MRVKTYKTPTAQVARVCERLGKCSGSTSHIEDGIARSQLLSHPVAQGPGKFLEQQWGIGNEQRTPSLFSRLSTRYERPYLDPRTKSLCFSDQLNGSVSLTLEMKARDRAGDTLCSNRPCCKKSHLPYLVGTVRVGFTTQLSWKRLYPPGCLQCSRCWFL